MKYLLIDTETGGLDPDRHDILQIAWTLTDGTFAPGTPRSFYLKRTLPATEKALALHRLTDAFLNANKTSPAKVYRRLLDDMMDADVIVGHHPSFDLGFLQADIRRRTPELLPTFRLTLGSMQVLDTKTYFAPLRHEWSNRTYPGPYLRELCLALGVNTRDLDFHTADADVEAMRRCLETAAAGTNSPITGNLIFKP